MPIKLHLDISFSNYRKLNIKKKILKQARGEKRLIYKDAKIKITPNFSETMQEESTVKYLKVLRKIPPT